MLCLPCGAQKWRDISWPGIPNGRISSIAVDPVDPNHWLLGAGNGGVWETLDSGKNWWPLSDDWPTLAIGAVTFAPSDPNTIYVGTGEASGPGVTKAGLGLMKSVDGGRTWELLASPTFARSAFKRLRVDRSDAGSVVAATSRGGFGRDSQEGVPGSPPFGIFKSIDGGSTWVRTLTGQATGLEIDPRDFNNQYAALGDQRYPNSLKSDSRGSAFNGLYRSSDGGQTWVLISGPWGPTSATTTSVGRVELAISASNPDTLYASIQVPPNGGRSDTGLLGLYRTDNAWAPTPTWIQIPVKASEQYCNVETSPGLGTYNVGKCGYSHVISVDPSDPDTLFAGGVELWRCANCGKSPSWTADEVRAHPGNGDYHALVWSGSRLISGTDHTISSSTDGGQTWQVHSATLRLMTFFSAALHPAKADFFLAGVRDMGGVVLRTGDDKWEQIFGQRSVGVAEAEVAVSASRPDTEWMGAGLWGLIGRTTDGGQSWVQADGGIDKLGAAFVAPVRICPNNSNVFLTGTYRMWRTDSFFGPAAPPWVANSPPYSGTILEIEYVSSDKTCNTYVYGTSGGTVQLTRDGGRTWIDLDPRKTLPPRPVNGLAFDPSDPNVIYAALSSFDDATPGKPGHVFKTMNALAATPGWVSVSPPLDQPFNVIRVDPRNPKLIYAGSDAGLWRSTDGAATWVHDGVQSGIPNASIYDIQINPDTGVTAVFTYGRGAYGIGIGFPAPPLDAPRPRIIPGPRSPANGATYIAGGLVPGSWAQVLGTNLSGVTRDWDDADFLGLGNNLPTKLSGIEVKVGGVSAAVNYVSPTRIGFQVPSGILPGPPGTVLSSGPVNVQVFRDGVGSNVVSTTGTSSSPGILPVIANEKNYPEAVFLDGMSAGDPANGPSFRKAMPGDVIHLFVTGLFRTTGGIAAQSAAFSDVTVTIGDAVIPADSASLVSPGKFQINFTLPRQFASLPEGDYPVTIQYNGPIGTSSPAIINSDPPGPLVLPIQH
ncbi:MAG: IPT/TIG domain-containing protein [Acidobacteria bacterium]|nr:IPT/TIG domain-containing protein [Acidobacteriota bacterium]